jgi:uncharacterized protein YndB with AHSA1/START domain
MAGMDIQTRQGDHIMAVSNTDQIRKQVQLKAPPSRVWRALTDAGEFGTWFGVKLEQPFVVGQLAAGRITHAGYEHVRFEIRIERIEPETLFAYRWHPYAIDQAVDYSAEPMTLVEFTLEPEGGGTLLTVVESGFDRIPAARRDEAFRMDESGWTGQMKNIARHVDG